MEEIITREWRVRTANATAGMNGVVPVVVVIGVYSVPAAIVRLERIVCPANAGIGAGNHDTLPGETQRPHLRRVCVIDAWFDRVRRLRALEVRRRLNRSARLRQVIVDDRIAFHSCHVRTSCQCRGDLAATTLHQNCINDVEGSMFDAVFAQPLQDRSLRSLGLV